LTITVPTTKRSLDPREIRHVMGHFATGVTIITTKDEGGAPNGITANAFASLSLDPPLVLVCIDKKANCYHCFEESKLFAVNFLGEHQEHISTRFATKGVEKFEGIAWHAGHEGLPLLEEAIGYIECVVTDTYEGGDHTIYLGRIVAAEATGDRPLLFFKGKYRRLPEEDA
jgi:flavin reductase (DIM6/NTAB) family NADH-FMN oxidoreductase RutF